MTSPNRYYGWKPSKPNTAKKYSLYHTAIPRPAVVDLRPKDCPIFDQGQIGSCTANGLAGLLGFLNPGSVYSRLFIYLNERKMEGTIDQDAGAEIHDGIQILIKLGCCFESLWPYDTSKFKVIPPQEVYDQAKCNVITDYFALQSFEDVLNCLASGFPVVFGTQVFESFESEDVASSGMVPDPTAYDDCVGGHCMKAVGYDDNRKLVIVANSWGTGWGDKGYCYISYQYFQEYANDMWKITADTLTRGQ
jgi:C1A family cysteine protease